MALRAQEAQRRRTAGAEEEIAVLQKRMRALLVGPGGGHWSAVCIIRALARRGFYAHRRPVDDLAFQGNWLLLGDKFHRADRPYTHAVALRGALWLDSDSSAPMLLLGSQLPTSFRPWAAYLVDKLPPN
jgi:hypothetical protein